MTRHVGEPSAQRTMKQGVWGVEDLRKRPAPVAGEAGLVEFVRAVGYTAHAVNGTSQITIDFDEYETSNASIFTLLDTALGPAVPPDKLRRVQLAPATYPGLYVINFAARCSTAPIAGTVELAMHDGDPIWGRPESILHGDIASGLTAGFLTFSLARIYPLYDPFSSGTHTPQLSFTVAQAGGANETFNEFLMEIHYLPANFPA